MEIMDYSEMLKNSQVVTSLVSKTIACSKDYVEARQTEVIDQMMEWTFATLKPIFDSGIDHEKRFRMSTHIRELQFADMHSDKQPNRRARAQFFCHIDGDTLRVFFDENGYWYEQKKLNDGMLKFLLSNWAEYKEVVDAGIRRAIEYTNRCASSRLDEQLKLHKALKDFRV